MTEMSLKAQLIGAWELVNFAVRDMATMPKSVPGGNIRSG